MKNIAIVTGASSGLGIEFVKLLNQKQDLDEIWIMARSKDKLEQVKAEIGDKIVVRPMDLSVTENIYAFSREEALTDCNIRYLVNSAGYAKFCSYDDLSIEDSINMIDLNVNGVVAMGLACLPHMSQGSHIINIASQASFQPLPYMNLYSSTKAFVRNYTRALNYELKEKGITATAVCPGWMQTGLFKRGDIGAKKAPGNFSHMKTPDVVAAKAVRDAEAGKDISVYSLYVKSCHLVAKLLPQKTMMGLWMLQQKKKQ